MDGFASARVNRDLTVTHGDDAGLYVRFIKEAVQNEYKSEQAGRPIFDEVDYCEIHIPGGKTTVKERVTDHHKDRFPRHWAAYQENLHGKTGEKLIGTPLDQWPAISVSQLHEWRALKIHTVDQLANLTDQGIQALGMGAREWKAKAQAYIASASESADQQALAAENERLATDMLSLQDQVRALAAELQSLRAQQTLAVISPAAAYVTAASTFDQDLAWAQQNKSPDASVVRINTADLVDEVDVHIPERARRGRPPKTA